MSAQAKPKYAPPSPARGATRILFQETWSTRDRARWPDPPPGRGRPAMLVPGLLAGDPSLARMAVWLRAGGWRTTRPGIRLNVNCMEPAVEALERRLEEVVESTGRRALVVGQSRGGTFGRVLARCRSGPCCQVSRDQLAQPVPEGVRYIAFYSRDDSVVSWEACLDPGAELVEVSGTHVGMGMNRAVWKRVAELLADGLLDR